MPRGTKSAIHPKPRGEYHHKDLRRALIAAALELIDQGGLAAVSIRALAKRLGVSHAAPAYHFADRQALLDAVATEGFLRFAEVLHRAASRAGASEAPLAALGRAYVGFAADHPAAFRAMFTRGAEGEVPASPELQEAIARSYRVLLEVAGATVTAGGLDRSADELSFAAWSQVHGLAMLWIDGAARMLFPTRAAFEAAASRTVEQAVAGLAPAHR